MTLTVRQVIDAARTMHPAFHPTRVGDPALVARLNVEHQRLFGLAFQRNRWALMQRATKNAPIAAGLQSGIAARYLAGGRVALSNYSTIPPIPLRRVGYDQLQTGLAQFCAAEAAGSIYLGGTDDSWRGVSSVTIEYIPHPAALTTPADTFALGDEALVALVAVCALACAQIASARPDAPAVNVGAFQSSADVAMQQWLDELSARKVGTLGMVSDGTA